MTTFDFGRSFATFTTFGRANNARIQVEAVCELHHREPARWVLVASCKAERTYAEDDLFRLPNYDFCAIFADAPSGPQRQYCIVRVGVPLSDDWREVGLTDERFEDLSIDLEELSAEVCDGSAAVVEATLANRPLVGRTDLLDDAGEPLARLHYPVKTMNANDLRDVYQVDTGPILVPAPDAEEANEGLAVEGLELAYIAWNAPDRAELIVQAPTPYQGCDAMVGHYSRVRRVSARNEILALT